MDFFLFTKSNWEEAPRLRHQVAELLASFGHQVMFFEKPSFTARAPRPVAPGIVAVRTRSVIHHQLRIASWLSAANRSLEKREIRRAAAEGPAIGIVNFNYDYDFLREVYPDSRMVTIINDDFIDGARWFSRPEASRVISATARISDQNLAVSYPLVEQVRRFSKDVKLFLPWARRRYVRPPHGLQRPDVLYWGYINDRIDARAVLHVMDAGIRIHFVGPVTSSANMKKILAHPNSSLLPPSPLDQISEIVDRCCASILPYDIGFKQVAAITMNNRAFELLSAGLPLLYAALPGLIEAPREVIYRCADPDSYVQAAHAAAETFDSSQRAIEEFLRGHSAAERYEQLMGYFSAPRPARHPEPRRRRRISDTRSFASAQDDEFHVVHVVGARPNFMKLAPVHAALAAQPRVRQSIVHTGQHYDEKMSDIFFRQLALPAPDINLEVGSASHAQQTAQIMIRLETAIEELGPDIVLVYGDVNSTMAAALVCAKALIPIGHVEAGLRSFDRTMPEEVNRVVTDRLSDLLFTPSADGDQNLLQEGVPRERIHLVGNVMIDTLVRLLPQALERFDAMPLRRWSAEEYVLVTLHRPSNVDEPDSLFEILRALERIAVDLPVIFPVHPRTSERMRAAGVSVSGPLHLIDPLSYLDFLALQARARLVITDSGGVQEETTFLRVPCLTLRANTERPITVTHGTNTLVGQNLERLVTEARRILKGGSKKGGIPPLWDGHAGERIANVICNHDWQSIRNRDEQRAIHYR